MLFIIYLLFIIFNRYILFFIRYILFFNRFINKAIAVQCLSKNEFNNTRFGREKIIATNGINLPQEYRNSNNESLRIVYIGRLEVRVKGLDLLIEALSSIKEFLISNSVRIDLYGPDCQGRYKQVEDLIKQYEVQDIVNLHHEVNGDEKKKILLNSDYFIQTSRHEGMPMGILEAYGYGIPGIITTGTSLGDITKEYNAGFVSDVSSKGIADAIINAVNYKEEIRIRSDNARKLIKDNFEWDAIAKETIAKYRALL